MDSKSGARSEAVATMIEHVEANVRVSQKLKKVAHAPELQKNGNNCSNMCSLVCVVDDQDLVKLL